MANLIQEDLEHQNKSAIMTQGDVNTSRNAEASQTNEKSFGRLGTRKKTIATSISYTSANTTTVNFDPSKETEFIQEIVKSNPLQSSDFYLGTKTILNSEMAAFKRALEIATKLPKDTKFIDPEYGPTDDDEKGLAAIVNDIEEVPGWIPQDKIIWLRPNELVPDKDCKFLEGGAEAADVKQGAIGDCWFVGAMSVVAIKDEFIRGNYNPDGNLNAITNEEIIKMTTGIFPPIFHWLKSLGLYILRFFKEGAWRYVIIDDRLPCYKGSSRKPPQLAFAHCNSDTEIWVPLIEKAYAKLHYSYQALVSGNLNEGLTDMTGLISTRTKIMDEIIAADNRKNIEALWQKLLDNSKLDCLMGCSIATDKDGTEAELTINGEKMGILKGHAYAITDIFELPAPESKNTIHKSHRLLRIRNPWGGKKEWLGKWSDKSDKLKTFMYKIEKYVAKIKKERPEYEGWDPLNSDDGTFLMCFKDWRTYFTNLFYAVEFSPDIKGSRFYGEWNKNNAGGFPVGKNKEGWAKNPQFSMEINKEIQTLYIYLNQPDPRAMKKTSENPNPQPFNTILLVFGPFENTDPLTTFDSKKIKYKTAPKASRDNLLEIKNIPKGKYIIVPSLPDPGNMTKFILSVYYGCGHDNITLKHIQGDFACEKILREQDLPHTFDDKMKFLLKIKAKEAIYKS